MVPAMIIDDCGCCGERLRVPADPHATPEVVCPGCDATLIADGNSLRWPDQPTPKLEWQPWAGAAAEVGDRPVQHVLVRSGHEDFEVAIDLEDGTIRALVYEGNDFGGSRGTVRQVYGDLRPAGRLVLPFSVEATFEGAPYMKSTIIEAAVNESM